ncbi:MAG TPA: LysM peptidoglycan-binding domain-containing M23 family metallopeptidase, partial [Dehalococcoidia bacterium]|nr:LysM peptidoglycan-binding domain-containing M23 family metallopeptidase [Dehalococcoidia bacterium]
MSDDLDPRARFKLPEGRRFRFNPLIAAVPVVVALLLSAIPGNLLPIDAFDGGDFERATASKVVAVATLTADQATASSLASSSPQAAGRASAGTASTQCEPEPGEPYCVYTVTEGDSLASIASRFGLDGGEVTGWELLFESNKPDLDNVDDVLALDQNLRIPTRPGLLHTVFPGESLMALAVAYDVASADIAAANGIGLNDTLVIGDVLLIPSPAVIPETPVLDEESAAEDTPAEGTATPAAAASDDSLGDNGETDKQTPDEPANSEEDEEAQAKAPPPDDPTHMSWPVVAVKITNYMTAKHPLGIDLGLGAHPGSNITAAADGKVVFAGGNPCCSYGYYVIVEHTNGLQTLY